MRFEEPAGLVDVELIKKDERVVGASIKAPRALKIGATMDSAAMADCVSLSADAIVEDRHAPTQVSVGLPFFVVETNFASMSTARPNSAAFAAAVAQHGLANDGGRFSTFLYARKGEGIDRLRARMFSPLSGTVEDPATGSASAALGAFLLTLDRRADAEQIIFIEQGVEMGRPSEIIVDVRKTGGRVEGVRIAGRCVPVMRGTIEL